MGARVTQEMIGKAATAIKLYGAARLPIMNARTPPMPILKARLTGDSVSRPPLTLGSCSHGSIRKASDKPRTAQEAIAIGEKPALPVEIMNTVEAEANPPKARLARFQPLLLSFDKKEKIGIERSCKTTYEIPSEKYRVSW